MMNSVKGIFSRLSDVWETPLALFETYNTEFHFTLDPCSTDENAKCEKHYTLDDNGLYQSWENEIVWCNPPYSGCYDWCIKALNESRNNNATVVMLLPSRTDTKWFHDIVLPYADEIRFIRGRLRFNNSKSNAPFASLIAIFTFKEV